MRKFKIDLKGNFGNRYIDIEDLFEEVGQKCVNRFTLSVSQVQ